MKPFPFLVATVFFAGAGALISMLSKTYWGIPVQCVLMGSLIIADSLISAIKERE